jgi:RHS repeat-associated protein
MPGQEFEVETGWNHNGFRDYVPGLGRYLESDPVGLAGGLNTFAYVGSNPLTRTDPQGLAFAGCGCTSTLPESEVQRLLDLQSLQAQRDALASQLTNVNADIERTAGLWLFYALVVKPMVEVPKEESPAAAIAGKILEKTLPPYGKAKEFIKDLPLRALEADREMYYEERKGIQNSIECIDEQIQELETPQQDVPRPGPMSVGPHALTQ